ncbi:SRPBCC family protein [Synechococcales cyanobacterium C]|uniref:SRPBCC family protein n=2 Tax=Petrachloros TaxID=2918834 RepID=A0A8K2A015_9CYAN|nr:SRPBCC family protein [Petrachloros mirabilis ULC683]
MFNLGHQRRRTLRWPLSKTYRAISNAPVDQTWQMIVNLADVSWHPLLRRTNVPYGLMPKPGLIYEAVSALLPLPFRIFVERVNPQQLLSVRILAVPGVEERVTYQIQSEANGTFISYSIMLRGWLAPLAWSLLQNRAAKVAEHLALAAEAEGLSAVSGYLRGSKTGRRPSRHNTQFDL